MTLLHVIKYLAILIVVLFIVKTFWKELAVLGFLLYLLGQIVFISFMSTLVWAVFITKSAAGWGWTFLFFTIAYTAVLVVYAMIVNEVFGMIGNAIASFIKRIIK